jgi:hypothetical protein
VDRWVHRKKVACRSTGIGKEYSMVKKQVVGEYDTLRGVEKAVMVLDREGFAMAQVSILAAGVEDPEGVRDAERFHVVVDGDAHDVARAKDILQRAEAEAIEVREEN